MWIMTDFGFFSVVRTPHCGKEGTLTVRGRVRSDLEALRKRHLPGSTQVSEQKKADYRYSFEVSGAEFGEALGRIVRELDYDDFKSAVEKKQGWIRHDIYEQVRSILRQLYCCDQETRKEEVAV